MIVILSALIAGQALAINSIVGAMLPPRAMLMEGWTEGLTDTTGEMIQRRQLSTEANKIGFKTLNGLNATQWNLITEEACTTSLKSFKGQVSNPSGMAICYNIPFLNEKSGFFNADLRVFMVAPATKSFSNIATDKIQIGLSYDAASVSPINTTNLKKRNINYVSLNDLSEDIKMTNVKREMMPKLIQKYAFVGQINQTFLPSDSENLQKILVPTVSLSAVDQTGATVQTSLSEDETKFVTGVFSRKKISSTEALLAPPIQTLVVAPDAPFIVPGLSILIFPIGLIITGIWTILIVGTIGYGTFGRIQWRERFRESKMRESRAPMKRI